MIKSDLQAELRLLKKPPMLSAGLKFLSGSMRSVRITLNWVMRRSFGTRLILLVPRISPSRDPMPAVMIVVAHNGFQHSAFSSQPG
jgi:hypothetical protein